MIAPDLKDIANYYNIHGEEEEEKEADEAEDEEADDEESDDEESDEEEEVEFSVTIELPLPAYSDFHIMYDIEGPEPIFTLREIQTAFFRFCIQRNLPPAFPIVIRNYRVTGGLWVVGLNEDVVWHLLGDPNNRRDTIYEDMEVINNYIADTGAEATVSTNRKKIIMDEEEQRKDRRQQKKDKKIFYELHKVYETILETSPIPRPTILL